MRVDCRSIFKMMLDFAVKSSSVNILATVKFPRQLSNRKLLQLSSENFPGDYINASEPEIVAPSTYFGKCPEQNSTHI